MNEARRSYDIILWGATGFTGQIVAEYLALNGPPGLRWALAGRNLQKLEKVRENLAQLEPGCADLALLTGDSHDREALLALARKTNVVCSTVGPYAKYGSELVAACVEAKTAYCDLTGEVQWIRRMIDAHHERARRDGTRIVHCCGFDSIPSDLGTLMLQQEAQARFGAPCREVKFYLGKSKGGFSGGTAASMLNIFEEVKDPKVLRVVGNPYALNPEGERSGPDGQDARGVGRDPEVPGFTGPFVMAAINTRIVRRSNALAAYPYGRDFRYGEWMSFPDTAKGAAMAAGVAATAFGIVVGGAVPPVRRLLGEKVLPAPGEGPSRAEREAGFFEAQLIGHGRTEDGGKFTLRADVKGVNDPGYGETAKMLGESALCLAFDELDSDGGITTPAVAMGQTLIERLRQAGMTFEVR